MRTRNQVEQTTLGLDGRFRADARERGGPGSADEDGRETSRSPGGTVRPHARLSAARKIHESASRDSVGRSNRDERIAFDEVNWESASRVARNDPDPDSDRDANTDANTDA